MSHSAGCTPGSVESYRVVVGCRMVQAQQKPQKVVVGLAVMAITGPAALAFDLLLLHAMLPPSFEQIGRTLGPAMNVVAWGCAILAVPASLLALAIQRPLYRTVCKRNKQKRDAKRELEWVELSCMAATASVAQVPAILAAFAFLFGSGFLPAAIAAVVSALGVGSLWFVRSFDRGQANGPDGAVPD